MKTIITIAGPTCSGKTHMEDRLVREFGYETVIGHTTRERRGTEVEGEDYYFVDKARFTEMISNGEFIEYTEFNGNYYGASVLEVERKFATGRPVVIVVDPEGARQIAERSKERGWKHVSIFLDIHPNLQLHRFLLRTAEEHSRSPVSIGTVLNRMNAIQSIEPQWRRDAYEKRMYSVIVDSYNEKNAFSVIDTILDQFVYDELTA